MGALKGAAVKMAGLREGRKSIIFVSEGFTAMLPPQLHESERLAARRRQSVSRRSRRAAGVATRSN